MTDARRLARAFPGVPFVWGNGKSIADVVWLDQPPGTPAKIQAAFDAAQTDDQLLALEDAEPDPLDELKAVVDDVIKALPPTADQKALRTKLKRVKDRKPRQNL